MEKSKDFLTGMLFFVVLLLLGVFTIVLSGIRFGPAPTVTVAFSDVNGLEPGHEVRVDGYRLGKVWEIEFQPDKGWILATAVFDEEPLVFEGATFWVSAASPLGGRVLEIRNPPREQRQRRLDLSKIMEGQAQPDALSAAGRLIEENRENIRRTVSNLAEFTEALNAQDDEGRTAMDKLNAALDDVSSVVAGVRAGEGTVGRLLTDDTIAMKIESFLAALDEGPIGSLLRDENVAGDVRAVFANLRVVSDLLAQGDGTLAMLIKDPTLYQKAVGALGNIERATAALSADRGVLGVLADDATGENLRNTVASAESVARNLDEMIQGVRRGEGTLGLLVADEEMRRKVELAVSRLDDFIEEQRENTTFLTFAVLLLGAF